MVAIGSGEASFVKMLPLLMGVFITVVIDETVTTMALPEISDDLNFSSDVIQWFASLYYISNAGFAIPMSHIGDYIGYRRSMQLFFIIGGICQLTVFFVKNFYVMLVFRFFIGLLYSGINSTKNTLMSQLPIQKEKKD